MSDFTSDDNDGVSSSPEKESLNQKEQKNHRGIKDSMHKTKSIPFFGRTTPIILQNDNGPCPLLAICNVLLLRNNLNLSPYTVQVSQEELLSLVAERLIDSITNVNNKDAWFVENQRQNISDAIDLLPRLATGIDVNMKFRRIDDFEFTPECVIFDLLDIPLYHGWIVDPQEDETATAIASKSYNEIMEGLVALETRNMEASNKNIPEDCVDFAAATTASDQLRLKRGDLEEETELLRILKLSETEWKASVGDFGSFDERSCSKNPVSIVAQEGNGGIVNENMPPMTDGVSHNQYHVLEITLYNDVFEKSNVERIVVKGSSPDELLYLESAGPVSLAKDTIDGNNTEVSQGGEKIEIPSTSTINARDILDNVNGCDATEVSSISLQKGGSDSSSSRIRNADDPEAFSSSLDGSDIYYWDGCITDSVTSEIWEPTYEGEVVFAKQADSISVESSNVRPIDEITPQQGELIASFLKNNANQLTFHGLFCLQDGLKEREICVFFHNNHFSTMFKYDEELYLLATDQGYLNQPDVVWEKLNAVNGDTRFMTGNFKEFKVDGHATSTWDEQCPTASTWDEQCPTASTWDEQSAMASTRTWDDQCAMANTDGYVVSIDGSEHAGSNEISDLQLVKALQQEDYEQRPQNVQQPPVVGASRLVTDPNVSQNSVEGELFLATAAATQSRDKNPKKSVS